MHSIMIIDDDDAMRDILSQALIRAGYVVVHCADGADIVEALKKHPADLLITDLFMQETDGLGAIPKVRQQLPETKIIAISGGSSLTDHDYLPLAAGLGAHRTLHKPIDTSLLLQTVRELLPAPCKSKAA